MAATDPTFPLIAFGIGPLGPWELIVILVIALLIFGRRLPEVGRSLGRGIVEFKKGIQGIEEEVRDAGTGSASGTTPPRELEADPAAPGETIDQPISERARES